MTLSLVAEIGGFTLGGAAAGIEMGSIVAGGFLEGEALVGTAAPVSACQFFHRLNEAGKSRLARRVG